MEATADSNKKRSNSGQIFSTQAFLDSAGLVRKVVQLQESEQAYAQGDPATSVMFIQEGKIKLSVVNEAGRDAIVAILATSDFFGEGCLAGQSLRMGTATALIPTTVCIIQKSEMMRAIHCGRAFTEGFMSYLLSPNRRAEEDLIDQLFNSSEKRLARTLLLLGGHGKKELPQKVFPNISQETLAEIVGTTRSRVCSFMNKFRKLGYIEYEDGLHIKPSLLSVVLHE